MRVSYGSGHWHVSLGCGPTLLLALLVAVAVYAVVTGQVFR